MYRFRLATGFGLVSIFWAELEGRSRIHRISLPGRSEDRDGLEERSSPGIDQIAGRIDAFLSGADVRFSLEAARMDLCTCFQRRVLLAEHAIPRGSVSTYARIAGHLGMSSGARAVGSALASNPFPILIPCHRAIRSDGTTGGYQGGAEMKRALLEMEGVGMDASGRVSTDRFFY
jgi:methylated-DNA-[protein]-cysteine S-methyltransferase